jgi:dienelactone hydrolase
MLITKKVSYQAGNVTLEGYYAVNAALTDKRPAVMVIHDWSGRNELACQQAEKLAELGYVGFALDMYGNAQQGKTTEEKTALMQPLIDDRAILRQRLLAALDILKTLEYVDTTRIGVMGFCFGGLCALDFARSGADITGVVSFHGLLNAPQNLANNAIKAKVLVLHGHDDPMVPSQQILAFQQEMTATHVDWQMQIYGNTQHGFTNPLANDPASGIMYNPLAAQRSMIAMKAFFLEIFHRG